MSGIGAGRITLDRTNLRRLADALAKGGESALREITTEYERGFVDGHESVVRALRHTADLMPDLYGDDGRPVLIHPDTDPSG